MSQARLVNMVRSLLEERKHLYEKNAHLYEENAHLYEENAHLRQQLEQVQKQQQWGQNPDHDGALSPRTYRLEFTAEAVTSMHVSCADSNHPLPNFMPIAGHGKVSFFSSFSLQL